MHEYEALLFANPESFRLFYDHHEKAILALEAIVREHSTPEMIDQGHSTAPSKRIVALLPDYADAKSVVGPQVAELIGLDVIRSKCRHFDEWLSRLEKLDAGGS